MRSVIVIAIAIIIQLATETTSHAYQLQPISRVFAPAGSKATQSFDVINDSAERIAVTVSFVTLERDESYVETNRDADDDFLAYPPQMILAPHGRQTVRVSWLGTPIPARELVYRIVVTQVPVELLDHSKADPGAAGSMRIMITYRGTLLIRPAKAIPAVQVRNAEPSVVDGKRGLAIVLENTGSAVGLVKDCSIALVSGAGSPVTIPPPALAVLHNTRVLAGGKRRYLVPWPAGMTAGPVKATGRCSVEP